MQRDYFDDVDWQLSKLAELERRRPLTPAALHRFVHAALGYRVPTRPLIAGHQAPFEYLAHSFFEDETAGDPSDPAAWNRRALGRDCIVWASRSGGKTMLGAIATLLDMIFKPGIQVRILAGSLEQSSRMYAYLRDLLLGQDLDWTVEGDATARRVRLVNGSGVEVLAASHCSVRGTRVHRLRCDEVDQIKPDVWDAAQMVTRSGWCGPVYVRGNVEALSTMHRPHGPMMRLIDQPRSRKVLRWCILDVIERCPPQRPCEDCNIRADCRGRAKDADGFVPVDDVVAQRERLDDDDWYAEMMCERPKTDRAVYPRFDPRPGGAHVTADMRPPSPLDLIIGGVDFGIVGQHAMLWARVLDNALEAHQRIIEVFDEYIVDRRTLEENLAAIDAKAQVMPAWVGADPAGLQLNNQTGTTDVHVLRRRGYNVRTVRTGIIDGIQRVRRRFDHRTLRIGANCTMLIDALRRYHFHPSQLGSDKPVKDGPDHACDALRYMITNFELGERRVEVRPY